MPQPNKRSTSFRKIHKVVSGGRNVIHYEKKKPSKAKCSKCGDALKGVPRERPYKMATMPKTYKRPERPYGGVLCSKCSRDIFKSKARV